ncbi:MAG TPA: TetR/AcrR family transcriptional regulator [Chitinophaga sp.]|uniref:TetR/AcrR family transcriptional regulator n=1 Tax=Chitinophaga sp. TaxID=1869181 RepID=UPI002C8981A3|nr:TetR/AcrR family transcriptional regulator [Chitinophaga sp.]HVI43412.1 TetR/AcrR family transcriptional regulator [Chitinophaga sp.]
MRAQKIDAEDLGNKLFETFSLLGYDGASMEALSAATGLKKASLYHRFPNGKKEMAQHVLGIVEQWIQDNVIAVSKNKELKPEARLKKVIASVNQLYHGGSSNCVLRTLSIGSDADDFQEGISHCFDLTIDGFAHIGRDLGLPADTARKRAKQINILIQGALVVSVATREPGVFRNVLAQIPALLTP